MSSKEYYKQYRIDNREHRKAYNRQWYLNNKERKTEYNKQWIIDNPNKVKLIKKRYCLNHPDKIKEYSKQYYLNNPEKEKERSRQYRLDNPEYKKQYRLNNKEKIKSSNEKYREENRDIILKKGRDYYKNNVEKSREYQRNKWKINLKYNLNKRMGHAIRMTLHGHKNRYHWEDLVGYNLKDLIRRLVSTIPNGYTWQDFLKGKLHIDHIIPISVFNFTKSEHTDFKKCWALKNLQLLPARENLRKSDKLTKPFQPALKIAEAVV